MNEVSKSPPKKPPQRQPKTGRINVYVLHSPGFFERLRPCHDSSADVIGELTEREASTLRGMIARYVRRCHDRHGKPNLDDALARGSYS